MNLVYDNEFFPHISSDFQNNTTIFHLNRLFLSRKEIFCEGAHNIFHIYEINVTTSSSKRCMTYECYIQQTMQMVELKLNLILYEIPNPLTALDIRIYHL